MEPWLTWAVREMFRMIEAIPGDKDHPRILNYHQFTEAGAPDDETPWCSAFVCAAMESSGYFSTRKANARSWSVYGRECEYQEGAIGVFWRVSPQDWRGHVGFIVGRDESTYTVLGGNQDSRICLKKYPRNTLLTMRWPNERDRKLDSKATR